MILLVLCLTLTGIVGASSDEAICSMVAEVAEVAEEFYDIGLSSVTVEGVIAVAPTRCNFKTAE
jgi:hypothetical protein